MHWNKASKREFSQRCHKIAIFVSPENLSVNSSSKNHFLNLKNLFSARKSNRKSHGCWKFFTINTNKEPFFSVMQHWCHMTLSCSFSIFKHLNLWQLDQIIRWDRSRLCFIHWNRSLSYIHCIVGFPVQCAPFCAAHFGKCSTFTTFMHLADTKIKTDCHWGSTHK